MPTQNVGFLSVCRAYIAKRSTVKVVFQRFAQFEGILALIEQPGSRELAFFVPTDRQTDGHNRSLYPFACMRGNKLGEVHHIPPTSLTAMYLNSEEREKTRKSSIWLRVGFISWLYVAMVSLVM